MTSKAKTAGAKAPRAKKAVEPVERWLPIPNYEGLYDVSSLGRVRSLARSTRTGVLGGRLLKPAISRNAYLRVSLSRDGKTSRLSVHRAVLLAFCGSPPSGHEGRHLNGKRNDNSLANLSWGSRQENAADRIAHGTHVDNSGERHGLAKLLDSDIPTIRSMAAGGTPQRTIARIYSVSEPTVSRIVNGKGWGTVA